jgi:hypothetical protein
MSQNAQADAAPDNSEAVFEATLFRLTAGLPRRELDLMVSEADECETALLQDIRVLEQSLEKVSASTENQAEVDAILQSHYTPLENCWTVSALLGRLQDDWLLPSILVAMDGDATALSKVMMKLSPPSPPVQALVKLTAGGAAPGDTNHENLLHQQYIQLHKSNAALLAVWKKISLHRSSGVFKRPVKPEEAPGYSERIVFPMDLSMIRKLIVATQIVSYADLHQYIALISHNCVKYNGRESEYGRVAREFEQAADEIINQAVVAHQQAGAAPMGTSFEEDVSMAKTGSQDEGVEQSIAKEQVDD